MTSTVFSSRRAEQGIALITVMLVLTVVTVALVSMSSSRQMDSRRTQNQLRTLQAWEYVHSLEAWAENQLRMDLLKNKFDASSDLWSRPLPVAAISEGTINADITELQGRLNLNNLLKEGNASDEDVQRLKRLFIFLDIKPELVDAILDWLDADTLIRYPNGAEDETYFRLTQPYRSANGLFSDVSELLRVQGITFKDYQKLLPYIYVADSHEPVNVNTATAMVLRTMAENINKNQAESLFRASGKPFKKVEDFFKDEAMSGITINQQSLSVASKHFLVSGHVDMGSVGLDFRSQLTRNQEGKVNVVSRMRRGALDG
ncbi:MAG: type II secretion system minor pseudopilin GspK [Methylococcaceae bacterium]|nr:type II secretion system minor pseudopilin GspK [Methylococcaceae bacterium]